MAGKISDGLQLFGGQIGPQMQGEFGNLARSLMPNPEGAYRANILPAMRMPDGSVEMAVPGVVRDGITGLAEWFDAGKAAGEGKPWSVSGEAITALPASSAVLGSVAGGVPKGALRTFGGINAKTADKAALKQAQAMTASGADRRAIWDATGWFEGPDQKWRFEIDDSGSQRLTPEFSDDPLQYQLQNDQVFNAYPDAKNISAVVRDGADSKGSFTPYQDREAEGLFDIQEEIFAQGPGANEQKSVLLHELQHAIQRREGFAKGGNPTEMVDLQNPRIEELRELIDKAFAEGDVKEVRRLAQEKNKLVVDSPDPYEAYRRLAGEAEARNVQTRFDMTPEQRHATPPWETLDIPEDKMIVRFGDELAANPASGGLLAAPQIIEHLRQIEEDKKKGPLARSLLAPGVI